MSTDTLPTNDEAAALGSLHAIRHIAYAEGYDDGKTEESERWKAYADAMAHALEIFERQGSDKTDALRDYRAFIAAHHAPGA